MSYRFALLGLVAALALSGCSKAPDLESAAAEEAVQAAKSSDAADYAPDALRMAEDTLNAARAAKQEQDGKLALVRKYGESKRLFDVAKSLSDQAVTQAASEKGRVRLEVENLLISTKAALDSAAASLAKAPKGKDTKAELALIKADLDAVTAVYAEAQADQQAGRFKAAETKLQAVTTKAHSIQAEIAAAGKKRSP